MQHAPLILNHLPIPHMQRQPPPPLPHAQTTLLFQMFRRKPNDTTSAYSALDFVMSVPEPSSDNVVAAAVAVTASQTQGPGWGSARIVTRSRTAATESWPRSSDAPAAAPPTQSQPATQIKTEEVRFLNIKIKSQDGAITHFKLKDTTVIKKLLLTWCEKHSTDMRAVRCISTMFVFVHDYFMFICLCHFYSLLGSCLKDCLFRSMQHRYPCVSFFFESY